MAHVNITKDLTEVKSKVVFGLTQRQLIFFALAALVAVATALPFFFFALYEKNGQTPEKMLKNYFRVRFLTQQARPYRTENRFAALERQAYFDEEVKQLVSITEKAGAETGRGLGRRVDHPAEHTAECHTEKATGKGNPAGKTRR